MLTHGSFAHWLSVPTTLQFVCYCQALHCLPVMCAAKAADGRCTLPLSESLPCMDWPCHASVTCSCNLPQDRNIVPYGLVPVSEPTTFLLQVPTKLLAGRDTLRCRTFATNKTACSSSSRHTMHFKLGRQQYQLLLSREQKWLTQGLTQSVSTG